MKTILSKIEPLAFLLGGGIVAATLTLLFTVTVGPVSQLANVSSQLTMTTTPMLAFAPPLGLEVAMQGSGSDPTGVGTEFQLNTTTVAVLGSIMGVLSGTIIYLFRQLVVTKDTRIKDLEKECNYWQSSYLALLGVANRAVGMAEDLPKGRFHAYHG